MKLRESIELARQETYANCYLKNYMPNSHLATLVWDHCLKCSSAPIPLFTFEVKTTDERLKDPVEIAFKGVEKAEIASYESGGMRIIREIASLKGKIADLELEIVCKPQISVSSHQFSTYQRQFETVSPIIPPTSVPERVVFTLPEAVSPIISPASVPEKVIFRTSGYQKQGMAPPSTTSGYQKQGIQPTNREEVPRGGLRSKVSQILHGARPNP